jgi:hypothetical protein
VQHSAEKKGRYCDPKRLGTVLLPNANTGSIQLYCDLASAAVKNTAGLKIIDLKSYRIKKPSI